MNNTQRQLNDNMNGSFTKVKGSRRINSKGNKMSAQKSGHLVVPPRAWSRHDPILEQTPEERRGLGKKNSSTNNKFSKRKFTMKRKAKFQEADNNYQTAHYSDQINQQNK